VKTAVNPSTTANASVLTVAKVSVAPVAAAVIKSQAAKLTSLVKQ
jgi:hypothetical protein